MTDQFNTASIQSNRTGAKPRRRYDSARRQAQAQHTRQAVLDAGQELITERGYIRTTIKAIAERAGVSVETVYQHFKSKPAVLKSLLDVALGGAGQTVPVAERDWVHQIQAEPDAARQLALLAEHVTAIHARLAPLFLAVRAAAAAEASAAEIWTHRKTERLDGMGSLAHHLAKAGALAAGITTNNARDTLFALTSPEMYDLLVLELHWPPPHYTRWLTNTLNQQLLAPEKPQRQASGTTQESGVIST
jgi:AcrR family transcriptional regulator